MNKEPRNLKELISEGIVRVEEYGDYYYVWPNPEHFYDERIYEVNKQTGKVIRCMTMSTYYVVEMIDDKATEVDIDELIKRSRN